MVQLASCIFVSIIGTADTLVFIIPLLFTIFSFITFLASAPGEVTPGIASPAISGELAVNTSEPDTAE